MAGGGCGAEACGERGTGLAPTGCGSACGAGEEVEAAGSAVGETQGPRPCSGRSEGGT